MVAQRLQVAAASSREAPRSHPCELIRPSLQPTEVEPFPNLEFLSPQERRIVALFALDYTNKEVGRELGICPETVKSYCRRIYGKLGVHTRAGCVAVAYARLRE